VSPEEVDESTIPPLTLPASSTDLLVANKLILQLFAVYEVLRRFRSIIGLSPFLVEDFIAALVSDEQNVLVSEVHCSLLRTLLHIEETSGTVFGPHDVKDSINISFYFLDSVSWFELARLYLESEPREDFSAALRALSKAHYGLTTVQERLDILQTLTDLVLSTSTVRDEMSREGNIRYDDHCRACQKLGDLLCCETCPSVYHLDCIVPPLETVPEDEWYCNVCTAHQVKGVTDCVSEAEKSGVLCRQEPLGYDRHRRKYWLLCRRLVVEGEDAVWYYSSKAHLLELLEVLDGEQWERGLVRALADMKEELLRHFTITEELYKARQGTKRSLLDVEAGALEKVQQEREERRKREEEERKQREEGDGATESTNENITPTVSESATHLDEAVDSEVNKGGSADVNGMQEGEDGEQQQEMTVSLDSLEPNVRDAALQALADQGIDLSKNKVNVISKDGGKTLMLVPVTENEEDEEEKGQEEDGGSTINATTTLASRVTRSRTGSLTPRAFTDSVSLATNSIRVARREATSLLAAAVAGNADAGGILTRNKATFQQSSTVPYSAYFRLGQDAVYRQYDNQYTSNPLALNRNQHNEERIKRQFFSHKFSLTATCEFKWIGALYGNYTLLISTLRMTMQQLESTVPAAFLHSRWPHHRLVWQKSVQAATAPEDFIRALAQLEACIKPAVFNSVWNDNLGYVKLSRCTTIDKEEKKRLDRSRQKAEEEEARDKRVTTFARFTLGLKHQVWKMKGEEFRVTGQGGWAWVSVARVSRPVCAYSVGLRAVARQLGDNIRRVNGYGGDSVANDNSEEDSSPFLTITNAMSISPTDFAEMPVGDKVNGTTVNGDAADHAMDSSSSSGGLVNGYAERKDELMDVDVCSTAPGSQQMHSDDVIDVSRALEERVLYPSVQKPVSRLDGLLERRLRLEEAEEKHRVAYTRILNNQQKQLQLRITGKFDRVTKKFELSSAAPVAAPPPAATKMPFNIKVEKVEGAASMPVEYKLLTVKSAAKSVPFSPDTCYSPLCRQATAESSNVYPCYSATCPRRTTSTVKQEQTDQMQAENKASVDTAAKHDDSHSVTGDSNSELVPGLTNGPVDSDGPRVMKVESLAGLVPDTPEPVMPPTTTAPVNGIVSEAANEPLYRLVLRGMKDRDINRALIKLQDFSLLSMMEDGKVKLTDEVVRNMALKLCGASSTKYFVALTPSSASRPSVGRPPRAAGKKTASLPPGWYIL
jgi:nucleosome-remodeling factor subunit BPTF